jgi:hypothetical protein
MYAVSQQGNPLGKAASWNGQSATEEVVTAEAGATDSAFLTGGGAESDDAFALEARELVRRSGVLAKIRQEAFSVCLRAECQSEGFEVVWMSHHRHPVVEMALFQGMDQGVDLRLRLRSRLYRLFRATGFRVSPDMLFARCHRGVVRVICVPDWERRKEVKSNVEAREETKSQRISR